MALEKEEGLHTQTREAAATRESSLTAKATEASAAAETAQAQLAALRESSESDAAELAELKTSVAKQLRDAEARCAELERVGKAKELELTNAAEIAAVRAAAEISTYKVKAELAGSDSERLGQLIETMKADTSSASSGAPAVDSAVLQERIRGLETQLEEAGAARRESSTILKATQEELQAYKITSAKEEATHAAALETSEKQVASLQAELAATQDAAARQGSELSAEEAAAAAAKAEVQRAELAGAKEQLAAARAEAAAKGEEVTAMQLKLVGVEKELSIAKLEAERATAECEFAKEKAALLQDASSTRTEGGEKTMELVSEVATLREREVATKALLTAAQDEVARLKQSLSESSAALDESRAAAELVEGQKAALERRVASLSKLEEEHRAKAVQVAARMVRVWRQKELRSVFRAWRFAATAYDDAYGLGGGEQMEGIAAAELQAKEEEMKGQIEGLTYRRRYIALRPVFRDIFNKFDKQMVGYIDASTYEGIATTLFGTRTSRPHWARLRFVVSRRA